jgi:hypothetical protein
MAALAVALHARGFKLGVYTDAGVYTCNRGLRNHSIPGSFGHCQMGRGGSDLSADAQDALTFASWGVE